MEIYCKYCNKKHSKEECIIETLLKGIDYYCSKTGQWLMTEFFLDGEREEEEEKYYAFLENI